MLTRYFDNNATTPLAPEVIQGMTEAFTVFGNPSSGHAFGFEAREKYLNAKEHIAATINCEVDELIMTSGGSESNNLCIKGYLNSLPVKSGHIITSKIEHPSVLQVMQYVTNTSNFSVTFLDVNHEGIIDVDELKSSIREDTVLISLMMANNETGSIQPIREIGAIARAHNIFFHTDAVQAVGKLQIDVRELNVDALSLSAHKFNGPKGIGVLYVKKDHIISPLIHGGGQERGIRGGTENVISAYGLGIACELLNRNLAADMHHLKTLKRYFVRKVSAEIGDISFNGGLDEEKFLPNTVSLCINGIRAEALSSLLSEKYQLAVSLGSACSTNKKGNLSHVLTAIGLGPTEIRSTIRISFGKHHTINDVNFLVSALKENTEFLRSFSVELLRA